MRFKEWCTAFGLAPTTPTTETGAVSVLLTSVNFNEASKEMYKLDDYVFSSQVGAVVWFVAKRKKFEIEPYMGKVVYSALTRARYRVLRVGEFLVQAFKEGEDKYRLWQDPISFEDFERKLENQDISLVDSREFLLENALYTLVAICQAKCTAMDEVVLPSNRTNLQAIKDALTLLKGDR